jgi:hypothetical protein
MDPSFPVTELYSAAAEPEWNPVRALQRRAESSQHAAAVQRGCLCYRQEPYLNI